VPKLCTFEYEIRNLPDHDVAPLMAELEDYADNVLVTEMRAISEEAGISWEPLASYPGMTADEDSEISRLAKALSGNDSSGRVSFGTEAGLFQAAGIPAVVCGPGHIAQAHKPNEFIDLDQVARGEAFVSALMAELCER
ncbi:MAG: M20/M25/M40 family metallo-hydrolase, partial [Acidiferrobacterales bacterium]